MPRLAAGFATAFVVSAACVVLPAGCVFFVDCTPTTEAELREAATEEYCTKNAEAGELMLTASNVEELRDFHMHDGFIIFDNDRLTVLDDVSAPFLEIEENRLLSAVDMRSHNVIFGAQRAQPDITWHVSTLRTELPRVLLQGKRPGAVAIVCDDGESCGAVAVVISGDAIPLSTSLAGDVVLDSLTIDHAEIDDWTRLQGLGAPLSRVLIVGREPGADTDAYQEWLLSQGFAGEFLVCPERCD